MTHVEHRWQHTARCWNFTIYGYRSEEKSGGSCESTASSSRKTTRESQEGYQNWEETENITPNAYREKKLL